MPEENSFYESKKKGRRNSFDDEEGSMFGYRKDFESDVVDLNVNQIHQIEALLEREILDD